MAEENTINNVSYPVPPETVEGYNIGGPPASPPKTEPHEEEEPPPPEPGKGENIDTYG